MRIPALYAASYASSTVLGRDAWRLKPRQRRAKPAYAG